MKKLLAPVAAFVLAMSVIAPSQAAAADSDSFAFLAGAGAICGLAADACPDVARDANGDTVSITGMGSLSTHPKSGSGNGTFTHKSASGTTLASGTWMVTDLLSFVDYGPGGDGFSAFHAGNALFSVNLLVNNVVVHTGILEVTCRLPGAGGPSENGKEEGVRLNVQGALNFNEKVSGFTVFIPTNG